MSYFHDRPPLRNVLVGHGGQDEEQLDGRLGLVRLVDGHLGDEPIAALSGLDAAVDRPGLPNRQQVLPRDVGNVFNTGRCQVRQVANWRGGPPPSPYVCEGTDALCVALPLMTKKANCRKG